MATSNSRDPTLAHISKLSPAAAVRAWWLVYASRIAGYPVIITSSTRSAEEQRRLVAQGRSQTLNSAHLTGNAFDIDWFGRGRDEIPERFWWILGPWAESNLDLVWGGRWSSLRDMGHFEVPDHLRDQFA